MWFVKARRAQNVDDDETWNQGGVTTTLNAFDNGGESRATVLIMDDANADNVCVQVLSVAYSIREDATANNFSATEIEQARALQALQPSVQSHHAQTFIAEPLQVRRLTPMECERLQGFPDGWTETQSDSQRYRQMGNAVTVNVIESIGTQLGKVI